MKNRSHIFIGFIALAAIVAGCSVDNSYNLENLDTEMSFFKGSDFPVPDLKPFLIGDYLHLDGYDYIVTDEHGDYAIRFELEPVSFVVTVPDLGSDDRIAVDFEPVEFEFGQVPDFLSGKDQQIAPDLSEMQIELGLDSEIPAEFTASCTLETLVSGEVNHSYRIDNLPIRYGKNTYFVKEKALGTDDIAVPGLGSILSPVPDALKFSEFAVSATADQRALVTPGVDYDMVFNALVQTPICFSADNRFTLTFPLDASLNLDKVGLKKAELWLDYDNTVPLNFSLDAYALNASGKRIDSVKASTDSEIAGLSSGTACVTLTTAGDLRFSSIEIELTVSSNSDLSGVHINKDQGLRFHSMHLYLPDGIQVRLDGPANQ